MGATVTEWKGRSLIQLDLGKYPNGNPIVFKFGLSKARAIVDNFEAIVDFVNTGGKSKAEGKSPAEIV